MTTVPFVPYLGLPTYCPECLKDRRKVFLPASRKDASDSLTFGTWTRKGTSPSEANEKTR